MRTTLLIFIITLFITSCKEQENKQSTPLIGTWQLVSATRTEKDSTFSTFNPKVKMIKIINPTHFAFLSHDVHGAMDSSTAAFTAGGGSYTLKDSIYTEHLEYFIDRRWENNTFEFVVKIENDTLIQTGLEKVENLGINHIIVEKYKRTDLKKSSQ